MFNYVLRICSKTPRNLQFSNEKVDPPARYLELYQMGQYAGAQVVSTEMKTLDID